MQPSFILSFFLLLILAGFVFPSLRIIITQRGFTLKTCTNILASLCIIVGASVFILSTVSATSGLGPLDSIEWPVGGSKSALKSEDGTLIVPHEPTSRIQIYNQSLEYLRGWSIDADGGGFKLFPVNGTSFYIFTSRGKMRYQFDLNGDLLSAAQYSGSYPEDSTDLVNVSISTPFYLRIFQHPFISFFVGLLGAFLLYVTGQKWE